MKNNFPVLSFILLVIFFYALPETLRAQKELCIGGGPSMLILGGGGSGSGKNYGIGARLRYTGETSLGVLVGIYYYLPSKNTERVSVTSVNSGSPMGEFDYSRKFSRFHLYLHGNLYLGEHPMGTLGFYSYFGLGYLSESGTAKVQDCDLSLYDCEHYNFSKTFSGLTADLGFGLDVPAGAWHIYGEAGYNFPFNDIFGDETEVAKAISASFGANLGVLIPLLD